jgi:hypothetical protein
LPLAEWFPACGGMTEKRGWWVGDAPLLAGVITSVTLWKLPHQGFKKNRQAFNGSPG